MYHERTRDAAKGKWRGILLSFGIPENMLRDKQGPCPMCEGDTRFRWDNKDGQGTWFCNKCGAGDGLQLVMAVTGKSFTEAAEAVDLIVGNITPETVRREMTDEERKAAMREVWKASRPVAKGDLVDIYLTARGVGELVYPKALRFAPALRDGEGGVRPCMVAMVQDQVGDYVQMHRTFLRPDGKAKAEMTSPRKIMAGPVPDGCAIRLCDWQGGTLGIAEGIETALSAGRRFGVPVWAAMNAGNMAKFVAPPECDELVVFGDCDKSFAGQAAAYICARGAKSRIPPVPVVTVQIPERGDWNDHA